MINWFWLLVALIGANLYLCLMAYWTSRVLVRLQEFHVCGRKPTESDAQYDLPWGASELWWVANAILAGVPAILAELGMWYSRRQRAKLMILTVYSQIPEKSIGAELGYPKGFVAIPLPSNTEDMESWLISPSKGSQWVMEKEEPWKKALHEKIKSRGFTGTTTFSLSQFFFG